MTVSSKRNLRPALLLCGLVLLIVECGLSRAQDSNRIEYPGEPRDWHGFRLFHFEFEGVAIDLVAPHEPASQRPWVWHGEFFGHKPEPDIRLLEAGFHCVDVDLPDQLGSPQAVEKWNRVYDHLTTRFGLSRKVGLVGLSRGGLYCYHWAIANPDRVACLYGDAPVVDFRSWPGGKGVGPGSPVDWQRVLTLWNFSSEEEAMSFPYIAFDHLEGLARAGVPLLHVFGDADEVVPWQENTAVVAERYQALGGSIELIRKEGVKHHPHGLDDPTPIVEFFLRHALAPENENSLGAELLSDELISNKRRLEDWDSIESQDAEATRLSQESGGARDWASSRCRVWRIESPHQAAATFVTVFEPVTPPQANSAALGSVVAPQAVSRLPLVVLLPVESQDSQRWGDARHVSWAESLVEDFGVVVAIPSFAEVPWYGDHPVDSDLAQERFVLESLPHFIRWNCPQARIDRDGIILVGFSKSGWGAISLLARHPDRFGHAVAFDAPLMLEQPGKYESDRIFPTPESFEEYRLADSLIRSSEALGIDSRITLISGPNFADHHQRMEAFLREHGLSFHTCQSAQSPHAWEGNWVRVGLESALDR